MINNKGQLTDNVKKLKLIVCINRYPKAIMQRINLVTKVVEIKIYLNI